MKAFIISVSCMAGVLIACLTLNITLDKMTKAPTADDMSMSGFDFSANEPTTNAVANGTDTTGVSGVDNTNSGVNTQGNNNSNTGSQKNNKTTAPATNAANPLTYSKDQIVSYYNTALKKTYSQPKITVQKKEVVDVQLGQMLLNGKPADGVQSLANKVIESNKKNAGTKTQSFSSNPKVDAQARFILPANLYSGAVKSYNVAKSGSGYVVKFTLNSEICDYTQKPPYNSSCTFPLDFNEVDLGGIGKITSATFNYPGTTLEATIDGSGRVVKTYVVMPLTVKGAQGEGMGQKLTVDISGQWLCTNNFSF